MPAGPGWGFAWVHGAGFPRWANRARLEFWGLLTGLGCVGAVTGVLGSRWERMGWESASTVGSSQNCELRAEALPLQPLFPVFLLKIALNMFVFLIFEIVSHMHKDVKIYQKIHFKYMKFILSVIL